MSLLSPKPIISRTVRTWRVPPGYVIALVQDVECRVWVVESCPAGTQFWTVAQAADLIHGKRTREALQEAVNEGRRIEREFVPAAPTFAPEPDLLPSLAESLDLNALRRECGEPSAPAEHRRRDRTLTPV